MPHTIGETFDVAASKLRPHSDSPSLDAQLLLAETLAQPKAWILAHPEHTLSSTERAKFDAMLTEVVEGAALPHVLGWWEFYGRRFSLDPQVLIPRPETELMVETALSHVAPHARILEIGTGSGCIAITLALELPRAQIYASDLSWDALQVARHNANAYDVEHAVRLVNADLAEPYSGLFDLICANLPYVATEQLPHLAVASREPTMALDGGSRGTDLIYRALATLPRILAPGGYALFEIDPHQAIGVLTQARHSLPSAQMRIDKDLAGRQRLMVLQRD
jgi:release factor glutamine methyltransferase